MSEQTPCKGCGQPCHPVLRQEISCYCLDCADAGRDEADETIAELRAERDDLKTFIDNLRRINDSATETIKKLEAERDDARQERDAYIESLRICADKRDRYRAALERIRKGRSTGLGTLDHRLYRLDMMDIAREALEDKS